jgi:3'-phosphoadenosine 5'-phosphosulfate sulfotransferase (PAPS reductase)/FAD synthetase
MNAAVKFNPADLIEVTNLDMSPLNDVEALKNVVAEFDEKVAEIRLILESGERNICHIPSSSGKDSSVVTFIVVEAYKQAISEGTIESTRPLIVSTVDTGGEAIPMKLYVSYSKKRLVEYAKSHKINIFYDIVKPPINDEYYVKYAGGQKLIPNATRHGDCSIILKVEPSERYVKQIIESFIDSQTNTQYATSKIVSCVGSRNAEGNRRSNNMRKQGIANKTASELMSELEETAVGNGTFYKYAPIKNWATELVFDALRIAGDRPIHKLPATMKGIPAYLSDFSVLLLIYGNGSNEVCEVSVGATNASSGCNGKARFGCVYCTMVVHDNSSSALAELPRWKALGIDNALKVRDFLFRLSTNVNARALHARAVDSVGYNRVALQPNILKPKYLEKMVRYASQLTIDSQRHAKEFAALVREGRQMDHEGYRDIANDPNIPPRTKKAFLEMYSECIQDPENLHALFSEEHALLLSFRWAIDGISAAPFRPLAIWKQIEKGEGRIPYPMLNSEYEDLFGEKISLRNNVNLPDAVMMPVLKNENAEQHALSPVSFLDLWSRPNDVSDLYDEDRNCTITRKADHLTGLEVTYTQPYLIKKIDGNIPFSENEVLIHSEVYRVLPMSPDVRSLKINGRLIKSESVYSMLENDLLEELTERFYSRVSALCDSLSKSGIKSKSELENALGGVFSNEIRFKRAIPFLESQSLFAGYSEKERKADPALQFTQRVTSVKKGVVTRTNTRLSFYKHQLDSRIHRAHVQNTSLIVPNFNSKTEKLTCTHDADCLINTELNSQCNLLVDSKALEMWKETGGLDAALEAHDSWLQGAISRRHINKTRSLRRYGGTGVAEDLLSQGVVSINKSYWQQLQAILKRTQVFSELGLFELQSSSVQEVLAHPRAITMQQHRNDKARVLCVIRKFRNAQRAAFKNPNKTILDNLNTNLAVFTKAAIENIHTTYSAQAASMFKMNFDTHNIPVATRGKVSSLWLALTFDEIKNVDNVLTKMLSQSMLKALKSKPSLYLSGTKSVLTAINSIRAAINDLHSDWSPLVGGLTHILDNVETCDNFLHDVKLCVLKNAPEEHFNDDILQYWNPNRLGAQKHIGDSLSLLALRNEQLSVISGLLAGINKNGLQNLTQKMSLSDKLMLLKKQGQK